MTLTETPKVTTTPTRVSTKPTASLSLDLDNKWSYLKTHGDTGWDRYPSYLNLVVPRVLGILKESGWKITWFVVGRDAAMPEHRDVLQRIIAEGHEIGNHSFDHEPWLHLYSRGEIETELARTEDAIEAATGVIPRGFRGPGFSLSPTVLEVMQARGYEYDCSTFPTYLGPLARAYYFMTAKLPKEEKEKRKQLFGKFRDGIQPLKPYRWTLNSGSLLEIPVTTLPGVKVPIHLSYLLYLARFSKPAAVSYWWTALRLCKVLGVGPSLLLHPLDFLGQEDDSDLGFFPAMDQPSSKKIALAVQILKSFANQFDVVPMGEHARRLQAQNLPTRRPRGTA